MPTPSSSLASRTSVISGSSSAIRIKWTSQVSGNADTNRTPHSFRASWISVELVSDTGIDILSTLSALQGACELWLEPSETVAAETKKIF
jgi:integrase